MYSIRIINSTENRTIQENFLCEHYKRETVRKEGSFGYEDTLTLYGVCGDGENSTTTFNLSDPPSDEYGKYDQEIFIMNENGKTIDHI